MTKAKTILTIAALGLAALGLWLWRVMPDQAWAAWDGERLVVVAEGWAVLWRGWPMALLGLVIGGGLALAVLDWMLGKAVDAEHKAEVERLSGERDAALAARDRARAEAESALAEELAAVERLRTEALRARELGHQAQIEARREVEAAEARALTAESVAHDAVSRAKNAICAMERRKRKSHPNQSPDRRPEACP